MLCAHENKYLKEIYTYTKQTGQKTCNKSIKAEPGPENIKE